MMGGGVKGLHLIHDDLVTRAPAWDVHNRNSRYFLQADFSFVIRVKKKVTNTFCFVWTLLEIVLIWFFYRHKPSITLEGRLHWISLYRLGKLRRTGRQKYLNSAELTHPSTTPKSSEIVSCRTWCCILWWMISVTHTPKNSILYCR